MSVLPIRPKTLTVHFESYVLGIDFRKFVCDNNDSGYKSTCVNEVTIDGKRSPRGRELAHELEREGFGLTGLGWVEYGLGWSRRPGWRARLGCCGRRLGRPSPCRASTGLAVGIIGDCGGRSCGWLEWEREREKKEREKERGEKEKRKGRERGRRGKMKRNGERD